MTIIPFWRAIAYIAAITCLIAGGAATFLLAPRIAYRWRSSMENYTLKKILERPLSKNCLPTGLLAEFLELSCDSPINLYQYRLDEGLEKLSKLQLFTYIELRKTPPDSLEVHYKLRNPIAKVANWTNTALDDDGVLFPLELYCSTTPRLPTVRLPSIQKDFPWGVHIKKPTKELIFKLIQNINSTIEGLSVNSWNLDLSRLYSDAIGEIALQIIFEDGHSHWLRLSLNHLSRDLKRYKMLQNHSLAIQPHIFDLRFSRFALIAP